MTFDEYQAEAGKTAIYPYRGHNIEYPTLGLCGEAGEIANKVKKIQRDNNGVLTNEKRFKIADEIGDVLWYLSALADEIDISLDAIADCNITKLKERQKTILFPEVEIKDEL